MGIDIGTCPKCPKESKGVMEHIDTIKGKFVYKCRKCGWIE